MDFKGWGRRRRQGGREERKEREEEEGESIEIILKRCTLSML